MDDKTEVILAQWQTCVEMANAISQRRDAMNNIFVTLNLAIVTSFAFMWDVKSFAVLLAGMVLCILWIYFIGNFKQLNAEKFNVINELEKKLPAKPFNDEWDRLKQNKKYKDGTRLERILPIMFIVLYVIIIVITIIIKFMEKGGNT